MMLVTLHSRAASLASFPSCRKGEQGHTASCTSVKSLHKFSLAMYDSIPICICVQVCVHFWLHSAGRIIRMVATSQYHYSEDDYCMYNWYV